MFNRVRHFGIWFVLITSVAHAQISPAQHKQMRAALDRGDDAAAEQALREMQRASAEAFALNNYDYLLARVLAWRGANDEATALFQKVIARKSPLAGYALWHQAEIARATKNPAEEQKLLTRLISQHGDHLWRERAIVRLSDSYARSGRHQAVIEALRNLSGPRRDAMAIIGEAQIALRQIEAARLSFEAVLMNGSMDDSSLRAVRGLDRIDQTGLPALSETDRLRRARVYQFNRYLAEARRHWLAFVKDFPQSEKRAEALFQLGRGYFLQDKFLDAVKWYNQVHDEFPQTDEGEQGFYFAGHCYQWANDAPRAIARYEEFLKAYPESEYFGYAHLNAIDTLRSAGRLDEALKWAARAQTLVKEPFIAVTGLFNQGKIRLTQGDFSAALADFTALKAKSTNVRGLSATTNPPEVVFMRAYCLEKLGRFDEAIGEYLTLNESRNGAGGYYGRRSSERLRGLMKNPRAGTLIRARQERFIAEARAANRQGNAAPAKNAANQALRLAGDAPTHEEMLNVLRAAYPKLRGYQLPQPSIAQVGRTAPLQAGATPASQTDRQTLAAELIFLGLYDEGASELAETPVSRPTMAFYCGRGNCANRTLDYSEPILNGMPDDYRIELAPREWAELFYPMPFREPLARYATPREIDPRFLLSIARQESAYNPRASSKSAARGMLQFIAPTANGIAAEVGLTDFEQSDLYNPEIAILLGSQYLKNLWAEFGSPQAVAAAYNGSEDSVRRWRARAHSPEIDRFVIEILKRETKDYVFRVTNYFEAYRKLYP